MTEGTGSKLTKIRDDYNRIAKIDSSDVLIGIVSEHARIHEGKHYFISDATELDSEESLTFALTPSLVETHMIFSVTGQSEIKLEIFEDCEVSSGTSVTPNNNNRMSPDDSNVAVLKNPTVDTTGNTILVSHRGDATTTSQSNPRVGLIRRTREIILKKDTTYVFEITSLDDDNMLDYHGCWYEL